MSLEDIARHKKTLEDKATTKSDFVASLRQLSSMLLTKDLLEQSMIGLCVNRVAKKHPDGDMRVLARNIVEKARGGARTGEARREEAEDRRGWRKPQSRRSSAPDDTRRSTPATLKSDETSHQDSTTRATLYLQQNTSNSTVTVVN